MKRQTLSIVFAIVILLIYFSFPSFGEKYAGGKSLISDGRYLVEITGCNDCHTKGWNQSEGKIPESEWLAGDITGWSGPWGTTYAPNLRLFFQGLSEDTWVNMARKLKARPPMPWWTLGTMKDKDLRKVYRFIKGLGPKGQQAPSYLPPGQEPKAPYFLFVPPSE